MCCGVHAVSHGSGICSRSQLCSGTLATIIYTLTPPLHTTQQHQKQNYRLTAPAPEILRLVSQAAAIEDDKWRKRRQALLQGPAPAPSSKNWREGRYRRLFFFDAAEGAPSCFPSPSPASPMPFVAAGEEGASRGIIPRNSSFYRPAPLLAPQHSIKEGSNEEEDEAGHSSSHNASGHNGTHATAAAAAAAAEEEEPNPPPSHAPLTAPHEPSTDSGIGVGRLSSAVSSSSLATTPRSSQQPPGAGGLAGGAAAGLLKKYTSLTTAATGALEVKVRGWVGLMCV